MAQCRCSDSCRYYKCLTFWHTYSAQCRCNDSCGCYKCLTFWHTYRAQCRCSDSCGCWRGHWQCWCWRGQPRTYTDPPTPGPDDPCSSSGPPYRTKNRNQGGAIIIYILLKLFSIQFDKWSVTQK